MGRQVAASQQKLGNRRRLRTHAIADKTGHHTPTGTGASSVLPICIAVAAVRWRFFLPRLPLPAGA